MDWLKKLRGYFLKWKHLPKIREGLLKVYTISPQLYTEIEGLDQNHQLLAEDLFYEWQGNAVTGSGADEWIVADDKTLERVSQIYEAVKRKQTKKSKVRKVKEKGCSRQRTKKYITRPSPPFPANLCRDMYKKGNDGGMYLSVSNVYGIYRWVKQ